MFALRKVAFQGLKKEFQRKGYASSTTLWRGSDRTEKIICPADYETPGTGEEDIAHPAPGNPFHLAIPVHSMAAAKAFYGTLLGLPTGRDSPEKWQDYCLFGHQIVCHFVGDQYRGADYYNPVDGDEVPVPHFGAVLQSAEQFHSLAEKLKAGGVRFIIEPTLRFKGTPGEQWTMFVKDPSGNNLEFKYVTRPELLFAKFNK